MRKNFSWLSSHFIETRVNEHHHLYQPEQSAVAGKSTDLAHSIKHGAQGEAPAHTGSNTDQALP